jgi:hypothetical protein
MIAAVTSHPLKASLRQSGPNADLTVGRSILFRLQGQLSACGRGSPVNA